MKTISIRAFAHKAKPLKNGEHSLKILTTFKNGEKWNLKYDSLGISVRPEFWDFNENRPTSNHPAKEWLDDVIASAIAKKRLELATHKPLCLNFNLYRKNRNNETFFEFPIPAVKQDPIVEPEPVAEQNTVFNLYNDLIVNMKQNGKCGTIRQYKYTLGNLRKYTNNNDISFEDIDVDWLNRYEKWLNNQKFKDTTISHLFRNLRTVFNKAIELDYISNNLYPFKKFKISKFDCTTEKRAIEKDDMKKIMAAELDPNDKPLIFARDLFLFSYFCGGINFVDMAYLTRENIKDDLLTYKRKKTGVKVSIPLSAESIEISNRYNQGQDYMFPIFDPQRHKTPQQQENRRHKVLAQVNEKIREVGKIAGIKENINLTTYVARHTFGTTLFKSNTNLGVISQTMGHKNLKTTQIYLAGFNKDEKREAFKNLV